MSWVSQRTHLEGLPFQAGPALVVRGARSGPHLGASQPQSLAILCIASKTWWTFRPRKKIFSPPPPVPQFAADTLPAPRPLLEIPPLLGFSIKNGSPLSWRLGLPLPPPRAEKKIKNIRNVHQENNEESRWETESPDNPYLSGTHPCGDPNRATQCRA